MLIKKITHVGVTVGYQRGLLASILTAVGIFSRDGNTLTEFISVNCICNSSDMHIFYACCTLWWLSKSVSSC